MAFFHKNLTLKKWSSLPKTQQILNIASELTRAKNRAEKNDQENMINCLDRSLELIDLTSEDKKWTASSLRELRRLREQLGELYLGQTSNTNFLKILKTLVYFDKYSAVVEI